MRLTGALASGLIGAATLTLVHELARRAVPDAPRVDVLGMRAIAAGMRAGGQTPPPRDQLYWITLLGDLASNALYYSLAARKPDQAVARGALLGLAAGVGAVALPPFMGLGTDTQARTTNTAALTVLWYVIGGLATGVAAQALAQRDTA